MAPPAKRLPFKRGDRVICVDDTVVHPRLRPYIISPVRVGRCYIVRECRFSGGRPGVWLEELFNRVVPEYDEEIGFYAFRFAPVPHGPENAFGTRGNVSKPKPRANLKVK